MTQVTDSFAIPIALPIISLKHLYRLLNHPTMPHTIRVSLLLLWVHLAQQAPLQSPSDSAPKLSIPSSDGPELLKMCEALQKFPTSDGLKQINTYQAGGLLFTATQKNSQSPPDDTCPNMLQTILIQCRNPADPQQIKSECAAQIESESWKYEVTIAPGQVDQANP